jgi:methylmalonyl-CoA mutase
MTEEKDLLELFPPATYEMWKAQAVKDLKGADFDKKLLTHTDEGIPLQPLYTKADLPINADTLPRRFHKAQAGVWELQQEIRESDPAKFNAALHKELKRGLNAIVLPVCKGVKSQQTALHIHNLEDLQKALEGIDLKRFPLLVRTGESAEAWQECFTALADLRAEKLEDWQISILADPFSFWAEYGKSSAKTENIYESLKRSLKENLSGKGLEINTAIWHNVGASATQELALALLMIVEYIDKTEDTELQPEHILQKLSIHFSVGTHFFMELAKFRAFRMLWETLLDAWQVKSIPPHITAETSRYFATKVDPFTNVLRSATETFSAIAGGVDGITVHPHDAAFQESSEFSRRIARNLQFILRDEAHLGEVTDPAGGSYFVEKLTEELAEKAWQLFQEWQAKGGFLQLLKYGELQKAVCAVHSKRLERIYKRKQTIVGVNAYVDLKTKVPVRPDLQNESAEPEKTIQMIENPIQFLKGGGSIDTLQQSLLGEAKGETFPTLDKFTLAENYEHLRQIYEQYAAENPPLKVTLLTFGSLKEYKPRADFSRGFMEIGGYPAIYSEAYKTAEEVASFDEKCDVLVICSSDEQYVANGEALIKTLREKFPDSYLILAGRPTENKAQLESAGLNNYIFLGADAYAIHQTIFREKGVL